MSVFAIVYSHTMGLGLELGTMIASGYGGGGHYRRSTAPCRVLFQISKKDHDANQSNQEFGGAAQGNATLSTFDDSSFSSATTRR